MARGGCSWLRAAYVLCNFIFYFFGDSCCSVLEGGMNRGETGQGWVLSAHRDIEIIGTIVVECCDGK